MKSFKSFMLEFKIKLDDKLLYEMANLHPEDTGLVSKIHIFWKGGAKHGPRIKVSNIAGTFSHDDNFTITSEPTPRIIGTCKLKQNHLDDIIDWVKLNNAHIHKVWHYGEDMRGSEIESGFNRM